MADGSLDGFGEVPVMLTPEAVENALIACGSGRVLSEVTGIPTAVLEAALEGPVAVESVISAARVETVNGGIRAEVIDSMTQRPAIDEEARMANLGREFTIPGC